MATSGVTPQPPVAPLVPRSEPIGRERSSRRRPREERGGAARRPLDDEDDEEPPAPRGRLDVLA